MLDASARLLRLLTLLQARATWSGADLADRLEVTARTLRRDVDRLRSLGYPVESTTGTAGGYKLGEGAALPPIHLDEDEATAVFVGLHAAAGTDVTGADTAAIRALSKLEQVLPARLRRRLSMLRTSVLTLADRTPPISLSDVSTLAVACSERLVTRFAYAGHGGPPSQREVEPHRIVHVGQRWYLVAWDVRKQEWRTFRVDRMRKPETARERFKARSPPEGDLVRYVAESLSQSPYPYRARVLLHSPPEALRARVTAYEGTLEPVSANRCILRTGARSLEALAVFVAMLGVEFEVIEPAELVGTLRTLGQRLTSAKEREC
jgi:predicted DNA-binding transcriptional regulator YafY